MTPQIKNRIEQIRRGEVPEGYKRTKAGIMPQDWICKKEYQAKEVFQSISNKKHNGDLEILSATQDMGVIPRSKLTIDIKWNEENTAGYKKVEKGDFVISLRSFQGGIEYSEYDGLVSPAYTVLKPTIPVCNEYYKEYFKTSDYISRLNKGTYGIRDGKQIGFEDFGNMVIHYPPLPEQKKIAEILTAQDRVIALLDQKIEQLQRLKKVFLQKMFPAKGQTVPEWRFPQFTAPWEQRKFSDFTWSAGERNSKNLDLESYAVTNDRGFIRQSDAHDEFGYMKDVDRKAYNIVKSNSFAYNPARINVGSIGYYEGAKDVIVSSLYEVFQTADCVDDRFLWHWFKSDEFPKWIKRLQEGSVRLYFYYDKLCECRMLMPSICEQKKIASSLDEIDNLIILHQRKRDEEKRKKKALMQLLLTGIVRVKT